MMIFDFFKREAAESEPLNIRFTPELLKKRAISGTIVLIFRRIFIQIIQSISAIILARILFPEAFGAVAILLFFVEFLAFLPSQGFVNAIIQKKGKITPTQISTIFWIVMITSIILLMLFWLFGGLIINKFYGGSVEFGATFTRLTGVAIILINIRQISAAVLERQIKYFRFTVIEVLEFLSTQVVSVLFAIAGWGAASLIIGYLVGKAVGAFSFYWFGPFKIVLRFNLGKLKKLVSFAVHYQIYSLFHSVSGAIVPIYVGRIAGITGVGYLNWAGGIGVVPWSFAELVGRVIFPVLSRTQHDKIRFKQASERALELILIVTLPLFVILFIFATPITVIIFTEKWLPAIWALRFFVLLAAITSVSVVASSALFAVGKVSFVRNISMISAVTFWILAVALVPKFGFRAVPFSWFLSTLFQLIWIFKLKTMVRIDYWQKIFIYFLFSVLSCLVAFYLIKITSFVSLVVSLVSVLVLYLLLLFIFRRNCLLFYLHHLNSLLELRK